MFGVINLQKESCVCLFKFRGKEVSSRVYWTHCFESVARQNNLVERSERIINALSLDGDMPVSPPLKASPALQVNHLANAPPQRCGSTLRQAKKEKGITGQLINYFHFLEFLPLSIYPPMCQDVLLGLSTCLSPDYVKHNFFFSSFRCWPEPSSAFSSSWDFSTCSLKLSSSPCGCFSFM